MPLLFLPDLRLHYTDDGPRTGPPVVFAHALGTDLRLWDDVLPLLPPGLRLIRLDMRGHGQSDVPAPPYAMGALVRDAERALDALGVRDAVFVGLSIGGLIAQGLAVKRLDLIRALVLSNTAAKIGTPSVWQDRIAAVRAGGLAAVSEATLARWFPRPFRETPEAATWRATAGSDARRRLDRRGRGHCGNGFLHDDGHPDPAHACDRGQRGWLDPTRSGARDGGPDPGKPLRASAPHGPPAARRPPRCLCRHAGDVSCRDRASHPGPAMTTDVACVAIGVAHPRADPGFAAIGLRQRQNPPAPSRKPVPCA